MAGIAGVASGDKWDDVREMLRSIGHRGEFEATASVAGATVGELHSDGVKMWLGRTGGCIAVCDGVIHNWRSLVPDCYDVDQALDAAYRLDGPGFVQKPQGPFAIALALEDGVFLARDRLGIAPLYYGCAGGEMWFASEVKALMGKVAQIREFPPGHYYRPADGFVRYRDLTEIDSTAPIAPAEAAASLYGRLTDAVSRCVEISDVVGCWLSGGLDSSVLAAVLSRQQSDVHTFAIGIEGASDLPHASTVAAHIGSHHHEILVRPEDLLQAVEDVIYHLESFDALLVRSSLTNYLLGRIASDHVSTVLSGEGSDELFAGYNYLTQLNPSELPGELLDLTTRLHNTALQRVDRCSSAHGLVAHTPYLDNAVVDLALQLPAEYKLHRDGQVVAKWVLRRTAENILPDAIVNRPKEKFWQGAGVCEMIASHADELITDAEFQSGRTLPGGSTLSNKEEYLYFRVFTDHFGYFDDYSFVGRTRQPGIA